MVNERSEIVYAEDAWDIDIKQIPDYRVLTQQYPELLLWASDGTFQTMELLPQGGQRFIFSYPLVNGCHACEVVDYASVAFDFDGSGQFLGTELLPSQASSTGWLKSTISIVE